MKIKLSWLAAFSAMAALAACGGGGTATPPQYQLSVKLTEDVPGTFGGAGAYEKVTGKFTPWVLIHAGNMDAPHTAFPSKN